MTAGEFLATYWLACAYFFIGLSAFYFFVWHSGEGSPNDSFWKDFFVACGWGFLWLPLGVAMLITWPFIKLHEKTGVYINVAHLIGIFGCGYLTIWESVRFFTNPESASIGWFLIGLVLTIYSIVSVTAKPYLPEWVSKKIDEDLKKKKNKDTPE